MKTACRTLAIVALIGILATFALIQQYNYFMNNSVDVSGETQSVFLLFSPLFTILATTAFALSFASGIMGMTMAGQRRQRIWFAILLTTVVVETYASVAIIMIPALAQFVFAVGPAQDLSGRANNPLLRLEIVNYVIAPLFAPLTALIYSLRAQGSQQSPANVRPSSGEEAGLGGLEYSRLDDTHAG
ncbi:MAG TPA: hypothetical protein VH349_08685 [Ktedonobacterales bacterium]|jgi:hypothetical protein